MPTTEDKRPGRLNKPCCYSHNINVKVIPSGIWMVAQRDALSALHSFTITQLNIYQYHQFVKQLKQQIQDSQQPLKTIHYTVVVGLLFQRNSSSARSFKVGPDANMMQLEGNVSWAPPPPHNTHHRNHNKTYVKLKRIEYIHRNNPQIHT